MTTVADPLSAGLMMRSVRVLSLVRASLSDGVRLSFLLTDPVRSHASDSTALRYASKAGSLFLGGFQVLFSLNRHSSGLYSLSSLASGSKKNSRNLILRPKASRSCLSSNLFIFGSWGANFNPLDSIFSSSWDSSTPDRLATVWGVGLIAFVGGARWVWRGYRLLR